MLKHYQDGNKTYSSSFRLELDVTEKLTEELSNTYQKLIGVLSLPTEIGKIDILMEFSCLSQHLFYPRGVYIDAVYRIFGYL